VADVAESVNRLERVDLNMAGQAAKMLDEIMRHGGQKLSPQVQTRLRGLPAMLRTAGVPATLAFYAAKSSSAAKSESDPLGAAYQVVGRGMQDELRRSIPSLRDATGVLALVQKLAAVPPDQLAAAFARVDALAGWLRRLSEAAAKEQAGAEPTNEEEGSRA
jgi:hypothetical protein